MECFKYLLEKKKVGHMQIRCVEGYVQKDLSVEPGIANLYGLVFPLPFLLVFGLSYAFIWSGEFSSWSIPNWVEKYRSIIWLSPVMLVWLLFGGVILHELIHGLTWAVFAREGFQSVRFGFMWKFLTPYCHCREPLLLNHYRLGGIMPALVLGIFPSIAGIISGNPGLFLFGLWFTLAAGGDFMILWMLRHAPKDSMVQDHPDKIGCILLVKEQN